ncbi:MAG TPA: hypothetical protein IAC20_00270 [Candidatus Faecisoma merdavium]|nr:hypothetical protein [Candidatus Faecisoma merdavium]
MSSVNRVNISSIKDYYQNFMQEKDNFDHVSYKTFSYSYLTKCSDSSVVKMKNELNEIYKKICNGYSNIERWWDSYIYDICETERSLSNENKLGNVKEGSVRSYINSQLPHLENFNIKFSENFNSGQLKRIDNKIFITNNVVSGSQKDIFFDLYQEYDVGNNNAKRVIFDDQSYEQNEAMTFIGTKMTSWILNKKNEINDFFDDINSSNAKEVVANKLSEKMQNIPNLLFQTGSFVSTSSRSLLDKASNWLNEMIEPMTSYFSNAYTHTPTYEETSSQITYEQLVDNFGVPTTLFLLSGAYMTNEIESGWNATTGWVNDLSNSVSQFFSDTCATISNGAQNLWNNVSGWVDDASNSVSQFFSDTYATISNGAQNLWGNIDDWWNNSALPWFESAHENVVNTLNSAGSWIDGQITSGLNGLGQFFTNTGKTFGDIFNDIINGDFVGALASIKVLKLSFEEGVFQFGEAMVDTSAILSTGFVSLFTFAFDVGGFVYSSVTDNDFVSASEIMWSNTKSFVSQTHVTNMYNDFYENTFIGRFISEKSYDFETVRSIGNGIGYTTGVTALTIGTFGLGSAAGAAGGTATAGLAGGSVTAGQLSLVAGLAGMGRGTETAWNNGASLTEGLLAGGLTGLWEGLQFYVGSKIGGTNIFNGTNKITNNFLNSSMRMILDGIDGGVEGFIQPLISLVYSDGYYDEFGNYIEFTSEDNFFERYKQVFDDNGGFSAVFVNAAVGTGSSFLGEIFDVGRYFENKENKLNIDSEVKPTSTGIDIKNLEQQITEANYYTDKGNFYTVKVNNLEEIPVDFWGKINDPKNVYIQVGDKLMTFNDAKGEVVLAPHLKNNINTTIEQQIAAINRSTSKGNFYTLKVNSIEEIPTDFWSKINNPSYVYIQVGDKVMTFGDAKGEVVLAPHLKNNINPTIEQQIVAANNSTSKGNFCKIKVNSIEEIPTDFWSKINDPSNVYIQIGDKVMTFGDAKNEFDFYQDLYKRSDLNNSNLEKSILNLLSGINDKILKARKLYVELNKNVHYDQNWIKGDQKTRQEILSKIVNFSNLPKGNSVICKGWSELYRDLLLKAGFDNSEIEIKTAGVHHWVEIKCGDQIIVADATDAYNKSIDLAACKAGYQTSGFLMLDSIYSGKRLSEIYNDIEKGIINTDQKGWLFNIDKMLGYANEGGYFADQIAKAKGLFENNFVKGYISNNIEVAQKTIFNIDIPDNIDGYEIFAFYRYIINNNFPQFKKNFQLANARLFIEDTIEPVNILKYSNDNEQIYQVYSKTLGRNIFTNFTDFISFIQSKGVIQ